MPSYRFCKIIGLPLLPPVLRSSGGFCCIHGCDLSCSISCGGLTNGVARGKVAVIVQRCLAAWLPPALSNSHKLGSCKGNTRRLLLQPCPCGLFGLLTMQFLFFRPLLKPSDFCLRLFRCLLVWGSASMSPSLASWCSLSCALLGCLAAFPVVATWKYLGLPLRGHW